MKRSIRITLLLALSAIAVWRCGTPKKSSGLSVNVVPADADTTCTVSPAAFQAWFADSNVTRNGIVTPANSVDFKSTDNCQFYCWSERMFMWMTSPLPNGRYVLESDEFYTVSPADPATGNRKFIQNGAACCK